MRSALWMTKLIPSRGGKPIHECDPERIGESFPAQAFRQR